VAEEISEQVKVKNHANEAVLGKAQVLLKDLTEKAKRSNLKA